MKKKSSRALALEKQLGRFFFREAQRDVPRALGFSGGRDSVVLAEAMHRHGISFEAWHFNHGWRGAESGVDALWAREWCSERGIPFRLGKARPGGPQTEGKARGLRWDFFQRQAKARGIGELWLAHHADDRAETLLLQLLRGAGPEGLSGTRAERPLYGLQVRRPLVVFERADLAVLARHWKLEWREDPSNADVRHRRNAVRHRLLPYLDHMAGRSVAPLLARTAEIFEEENAYWDALLSGRRDSRLEVRELRAHPVAWQRRVIRKWLLASRMRDVGFDEIEAIRGLLYSVRPARVNLSKDWHCRRTRGQLWLEG
jgi:tRNA(Ile)-lysidine synthase